MVLGALLDLGMPLDGLREALGSLAIDYGGIDSRRVLRAGVSATRFLAAADAPDAEERHDHAHEHGHAHAHEHGHAPGHGHEHDHDHAAHDHGPHAHSAHHHHSLAEIRGLIARSSLSREGQDRAVHLFERLAEAEAFIHQMPLERIHLHEVGALDSIIDIVGAVYGMEWLAADDIVASPLNVGSGTVRCAHGVFPVPAPATALLLKGVPVYAGDVAMELVTPTGALLVTDYARSYGPLPPMRLEAVGYGAGGRDTPGNPNVLRLLLGEATPDGEGREVVVLECEIDDMNPQLFGPLMDRLFAGGALDVFYAPVQMKKNRPGTLVTVLAPPARREALSGLLFTETTTIGIRSQAVRRECLDRELRSIETPLGPVRFKVATRKGRVVNASAEFDDCARIAAERGIPIKDVQAMATKAWLDAQSR
jgi:uncharacterized protein (TIGR00299 family) protein